MRNRKKWALRDKLTAFASGALTVGVLGVYSTLLNDFMREFGFWLFLPLLLFVTVGVFRTAYWLEVRITPKSLPDIDIHDDHFPVPSVKAADWDDSTTARLAAHFMGWDAAPENIAWAKYPFID